MARPEGAGAHAGTCLPGTDARSAPKKRLNQQLLRVACCQPCLTLLNGMNQRSHARCVPASQKKTRMPALSTTCCCRVRADPTRMPTGSRNSAVSIRSVVCEGTHPPAQPSYTAWVKQCGVHYTPATPAGMIRRKNKASRLLRQPHGACRCSYVCHACHTRALQQGTPDAVQLGQTGALISKNWSQRVEKEKS